VVTDLQMPRQDGLGLQEALARSGNPLPVVFLTSKGDIPTTVRAMRRGAEDFLTKRAPKTQLLEAIERALERGQRERQKREKVASAAEKSNSLSPRERQVLSGVARGLLNKEIAAELGVAERTVKLHRSNLSAKLGLRSAAELALFARESGVVGG
jgi:FixJ family two-component response regulator